MDRIILHVGYPKTGTTTLQDAWFYNLHTSGLIKYYGKCTQKNANLASGEQLLLRQFTNLKRDSLPLPLDKRVSNVFSDERICLPLVFKQNSPQYGRDAMSIADSAAILSNVFQNHGNVTILITIRNQCNLIRSIYAHYYYYLRTHPSYSDISGFIDHILHESHVFEFDKIASHFAKLFDSDNVRILPFELMMNEPDRYIQTLSDILQLPEGNLYESVNMDAHLNKSKSRGNLYIKQMGVIQMQYLRKLVDPIYPVVKMEEFARSYLSDDFVDVIKQKFLTNVTIPPLDDSQINMISEHYARSNLNLSNEYDISQNFLKKNGYIT